MTRFEDPFNAGQPADELEDELRQVLIRREADITEAAQPRTDGELPVTPIPGWVHRVTELPGGRTGTLLAASVVALLMLSTTLAVRGLTHDDPPVGAPNSPAASTSLPTPSTTPSPTPSPTPSATRTSLAAACPLPAKWLTALEAGVVAVDQPLNRPLAAGPDGSFLMEQSNAFTDRPASSITHRELALFDRDGHGTTIWLAAEPQHDLVGVSPDSALSAGWAVFALARTQNLAAYGVAAWDRAAGRLSTVRLLSPAEQEADLVIAFDPIVAGDTAYWIEQKRNDTAYQTLVSQQLPYGQRHTRPVADVGRLVAVGTGVGLLLGTGPDHFPILATTLAAGPGLTVPAEVLEWAGGRWFSSDGTSLRWQTDQAIVSWRPGQSTVSRTGLARPLNGPFVGPFADIFTGSPQEGTMMDTRNGTLLRLPAGLRFVLVAGGDLITVTGDRQDTVHRVPLTALPATRC
ncbi:MAG TPA: hypothetical protein VF557_15630 [Jatrophihabitans sp.]|jgi:hypothetical protein|uniref:hypothetical protein n=1 Tax=Jatrophihabitans sp. TaxID=1932789 RepID=UPI002F2050D5